MYAEGPLFEGLVEGPTTVVRTEDAVMELTMGAKEATQTVGIVGTDVTVTL